jgi:hypothetical protein
MHMDPGCRPSVIRLPIASHPDTMRDLPLSRSYRFIHDGDPNAQIICFSWSFTVLLAFITFITQIDRF